MKDKERENSNNQSLALSTDYNNYIEWFSRLCLLFIRHDLSLDQKISLIKERDTGTTYRILAGKYKISLGAVANIIKRRDEYLSDDERNENKETKRKMRTRLMLLRMRRRTLSNNSIYFSNMWS
jgi:hypothetical protein